MYFVIYIYNMIPFLNGIRTIALKENCPRLGLGLGLGLVLALGLGAIFIEAIVLEPSLNVSFTFAK